MVCPTIFIQWTDGPRFALAFGARQTHRPGPQPSRRPVLPKLMQRTSNFRQVLTRWQPSQEGECCATSVELDNAVGADRTRAGQCQEYLSSFFSAKVVPGLASECREGSGRYVLHSWFLATRSKSLPHHQVDHQESAILPHHVPPRALGSSGVWAAKAAGNTMTSSAVSGLALPSSRTLFAPPFPTNHDRLPSHSTSVPTILYHV